MRNVKIAIDLQPGKLFYQRNHDFVADAGIDSRFYDYQSAFFQVPGQGFAGALERTEVGLVVVFYGSRYADYDNIGITDGRKIAGGLERGFFDVFGDVLFADRIFTIVYQADLVRIQIDAGDIIALFGGQQSQRQAHIAEPYDGNFHKRPLSKSSAIINLQLSIFNGSSMVNDQ